MHKWRFFRGGGFDQVKLETGADLIHIEELDQKLWVALTCPVHGLELDSRTLELIDHDNDGRVRAPELVGATQWVGRVLKDPEILVKGLQELPLAAINTSSAEGQLLADSARHILDNLGKNGAKTISIEDVSDTDKIFSRSRFNGDGIITILSAEQDAAAKKAIEEILSCTEGVPDRSGELGVDREVLERFFGQLEAFSAWHKKAEESARHILPLGEATPEAVAALEKVRGKIDDFFTRCAVAVYEPVATVAMNRQLKDYEQLSTSLLHVQSEELAGFPIAKVVPEAILPLTTDLNPAWNEPIGEFAEYIVGPLVGARSHLTPKDWEDLKQRVAPFLAWQKEKPPGKGESLGLARIRELLASPVRVSLEALIAKDEEERAAAARIIDVERLIRYVRDLHLLCRNFVNFEDFLDGGPSAIFQCGTLFLDERACTLCVKVEDHKAHSQLAALAGVFLAYLKCERKASNESYTIAAAFTNGSGDNLMVGRNGLFYDRRGRDFDATIISTIENPISVREAFWSPYKRFVRLLEEQVAKRAATADSQSVKTISTGSPGAPAAKPAAPAPQKIDVGTVAAMGVAVGAIGGFLTAVWANILGVIQLGPLAMVGAFLGLLLLISGPSLILALIKLRKRQLGPVLDASGWAINAQTKISVPFGATLTEVAKLPPGAECAQEDPYADKTFPWLTAVIVVIVLALGWRYYIGGFDAYLPNLLDSVNLLGPLAPR